MPGARGALPVGHQHTADIGRGAGDPLPELALGDDASGNESVDQQIGKARRPRRRMRRELGPVGGVAVNDGAHIVNERMI